MTIARWIARHGHFQPDKDALVCDDRSWTYGELDRAVSATALALSLDMGIARGERIAYYGLNSAELLILLFACARLGIILVPLNWRLAAPEIEFILSDCGVSAIFVDDNYAPALAELSPDLPPENIIGIGNNIGGFRAFSELVDVTSDNREDALANTGALTDPLLIIYTSGTTGRPKGAVLTQEGIQVNAANSVHMHDMGNTDRVLSFLPMFHVGGLNIQSTPALQCGATIRLMSRFEPGETFDAIEKFRPTLMLMVPAIMQAMLNHPRWDAADLTCLRSISTGSTDVPVPLIEGILARGIPVQQIYGSTETGPVAIYQRADQARSHIGSIGQAGLECDVRIVDTNGNEMEDGQAGEILIRGGNILAEYWRNPIETERVLVDGWFHTGDIAQRDGQGFYWFADRIKHVIISGGENIYPAELERVLNGIDGVSEAVVIGQTDDKWGEVPIAVVVRGSTDLVENDIMAIFNNEVARFKHPRAIVFVDQLPRNVMGKVVVEDVKAMILAL